MPKNRDSEKSFSSYMTSAFQHSMVTGIPQIAGAGNIPKKIIRTTVFIFCVAGFIYQSLSFLNLYWEYHTVLDVQVQSSRITERPAVTICNRNGLMMSKVCEERPDDCAAPSGKAREKFCECNPRYCPDGELPWNFSIGVPRKIMDLNRLPEKDVKHLLIDFKTMVQSCVLRLMYEGKYEVRCNIDDVLSVRSQPATIVRNVCYTLFSLVGKPDDEYEQVLSRGDMSIGLDLIPTEYHFYAPHITAQVSFHDARTLSNPYVEGFRMDEGQYYSFVLSKVVKKLLPEPYETRCIDYIQKWKDRGGQGPLTEEACMQECWFKAAMQVYNCVPVGILYPNNERVCSNQDRSLQDLLEQLTDECSKDCKPACLHVRYEATVTENEYGVLTCGKTNMDGRTFTSIKLNNMQTTTYIYNPKFERIETFSYLGGYVGMWLGISLVAVFDFIETLVMILKYPFASINLCGKRNKTRVRNVSKINHY